MADNEDDEEGTRKGGKPELTPEQEAEAAAKKAARAEAKAKGGKGQGQGAAAPTRSRTERVKRDRPPRLRKLYDAEVRAEADEGVQLQEPDAGRRAREDHVNMGLGEAVTNPKMIDTAVEELGAITGQKPGRDARQEVDRDLQAARGPEDRRDGHAAPRAMWEFLDRLVTFALPRVRDFKGVSPKAFDGRGNYTLGVREQIIFPEIDYDKLDKIKGMNITFVTTAPNDEQGRALLRHLGMPFRN